MALVVREMAVPGCFTCWGLVFG